MAQKKQTKIMDWVKQKLPSYYLWIAEEYRGCQAIKNWKTGTVNVSLSSYNDR